MVLPSCPHRVFIVFTWSVRGVFVALPWFCRDDYMTDLRYLRGNTIRGACTVTLLFFRRVSMAFTSCFQGGFLVHPRCLYDAFVVYLCCPHGVSIFIQYCLYGALAVVPVCFQCVLWHRHIAFVVSAW